MRKEAKAQILTTPEHAIIVAGGKGTRIKSAVPKQFIPINGLPVLLHTLNAFYRYSETIKVILVIPKDDVQTWKQIASDYKFTKPIVLAEGGDTRFQSVKNGLSKIEGGGLVAIHDGVRPLVSEHIIGASFRLAAMHGSAIAAVRLKESLRSTNQDQTKAEDRSKYRLIQTPQTFDVASIKKAYQIKEDETLTDDASVAERSGIKISLFEGSYRNIKITTEEDLIIAKALLTSPAAL